MLTFALIKSTIFKTIADESTLSGQRIVGVLQARRIAQQQASAQLEVDVACLKQYEIACQGGSVSTQQFDSIMKKASLTAKEYTTMIKQGTGSAETYAQSQMSTNVALQSVGTGAKVASAGVTTLKNIMNTVWIFAIINAVLALVQGISSLIDSIVNANEIAIEKANELLNKFNSDIDDLVSKKSTLQGLESEFNKLSKGVDEYGKNVSLTADEYERYQDIVETIVGINPSLITGWDEEGNVLARKNGLLEDSIQLLKDEYQQKIKNMALPENIGTAMDGAAGRYNTAKEKFYDVELPASKLSGVKIDADGNESYGYATRVPQYIEDVIGVEYNGEGVNKYVLNNAEAVFSNLDKIKERAAETKDGWKGLTDSQIIDLMDYFKELKLAYNDMNAAATSANSTLQYVAMAEDSYAGLTDKQKAFISNYINGIKITAETTEQEKDAIRKSIISITNELANHPEASQLFEDLYALPKDELPADEYITKYKQLVEDIIKTLDGDDGTGLSEEQEIEIRARFNIVDDENTINTIKEELKDKVQGDLGTLSFEDLKIAYENIDFGSGVISLEELIVKIEEYKKTLQDVTDSLDSLASAIKAAESAFELFNEVEKDFNSTGVISAENIQKILSKFPELEDELYEYIMGMRTGASVMDLLKTKSDDMATMSAEAFKKMYLSSNSVSKDIVTDHKSAFDYVAKGWDATKSVMANVNSQIIDANGSVCTTFAEQWKTACEVVGTNMQALASGFASFVLGDGYSDGKGIYRKDDTSDPNYKAGYYSKTYYDTSGAGTNLTEAKTIELYGENYTEDQYQFVFEAQKKQRADIVANNAELERIQEEFKERMKQFVITSDNKSGSNYEDLYDEWLETQEKDIEDLDEAIAKINKKLEHAIKTGDAEQINILSEELDNGYKMKKTMLESKAQLAREQLGIIMEEIYNIAPHLRGKSISEITPLEIEEVSLSLGENSKKWDSLTDSALNYYETITGWSDKWWENESDRLDNEKSYYDTVLNELDRYAERIEEHYDDQIKYEEALLKIKQAQFEAQNNIADAQAEIDKEIRNSRNSKQYLSKSEYEKIFNEEDYEELSDIISDIDDDISNLTDDFYKQIEDAYANGQVYLVEHITDEYERQLAMKERELEIAKANVDLEKKRLTLENALAEKNIKQYSENGITWVADQEKVKQATEDFADAQAEIANLQKKATQQRELDSRQANIDMLEMQKNALNDSIENLKEAIEDVTDPLADFGVLIQNLINDTNKSISKAAESVNSNVGKASGNTSYSNGSRGGSGGSGGSGGGYIGGAGSGTNMSNFSGATVDVKGVGKFSADVKDGKTQNPGLKPGDVVNTTDGRHWEITGGTAGNYTSKEVDKSLYDSGGVASGKGLMLKGVDEEETVLPPWLTKEVLTPEYNENFSKLLENMQMVSLFNPSDFVVQPQIGTLPTRDISQPTSMSKTWTGNMYVEGGDPNEILKAISDAFDRNMP